MKIIGMIGGIGPESTIDYYKRLLEGTKSAIPAVLRPASLLTVSICKKGCTFWGPINCRS
jgi:aspartate/glutamate racemase